jgi:FlaA1/EpsC-like NDP-sugar epimerase
MKTTLEKPRIYIIGAGFAGRAIAHDISSRPALGRVVAFLDDDRAKVGTQIEGVPVLGPISDVVSLLGRSPADEAIIAIPSAGSERLRELYFLLKRAGFSRIRILPSVAQIIEGDAHLVQTREVKPQDFLGRRSANIGLKESLSYLSGKRVIVSGAGGSIGSEISRQLLHAGVERLYLYGHGENSIYEIDRELRLLQSGGVGVATSIVPVIGELKDPRHTKFVVKRTKAHAIFHCAAYKHVPMMEENPVAAIENNVFGTHHLVEAALEAGTERFVLISTDKAVDPVSTYGASKALAERLVLSAAKKASTSQAFMMVRFGNVLGSRGSIIPLFKRQIEKGGPVTVTHPDMSRYFMTIPEACSLVLKAGGAGENAGAYLLDMGQPIKIVDLAEQMIRFYGLEPGRDVAIDFIGLRAGERLEERLVAADERTVATRASGILRLERATPVPDPTPALEELAPICGIGGYDADDGSYRNRLKLRAVLKKHVPTVMVPDDEAEF